MLKGKLPLKFRGWTMLKDAESTWKKPLKFAIFHRESSVSPWRTSNGKSPRELNLHAVQDFPATVEYRRATPMINRVVVLGPRTVFWNPRFSEDAHGFVVLERCDLGPGVPNPKNTDAIWCVYNYIYICIIHIYNIILYIILYIYNIYNIIHVSYIYMYVCIIIYI